MQNALRKVSQAHWKHYITKLCVLSDESGTTWSWLAARRRAKIDGKDTIMTITTLVESRQRMALCVPRTEVVRFV